VSYGAIGHVLGHELTHGFDTLGNKLYLSIKVFKFNSAFYDVIYNFFLIYCCKID